MRVQFVEDNGTQYVADTHYDGRRPNPQNVRGMFQGGIRRPIPNDPDANFTPENIREIIVGINGKRHSNVGMTVSNLEWTQ